MFYFWNFIMAKKTETKSRKVNLQRAKDIAEIISTLSQFTPGFASENILLFSRHFLLKNLLGFTEEELEENDSLINDEYNTILRSLEYMRGSANQETPEVVTKTKVKKPTIKVS